MEILVLVPVLVQVMVRVEKHRGHPFPKLARSLERRNPSCLAMAEERDIIANREEMSWSSAYAPRQVCILNKEPYELAVG
ncbi:conserved hypothetical protein [Ricinus communis]|uniref:Uncharacterized protein n=1 Tax=Ricinus communis TaxID=3988 RepID=B9SLJ6_RICCO|nr:conserved hypothetical protein [Ricinus communis]